MKNTVKNGKSYEKNGWKYISENYYPHDYFFEINDKRLDELFDKNGNEISYDVDEVNTYVNANKYKELRAAEYPSIADQLDTIYHDGIDAWKSAGLPVQKERQTLPPVAVTLIPQPQLVV